MNDEAKSGDEVLVFECELDEPIERVWRALSEPDLLAAWLMPNDFVPERGHRFRFTPSEPGEPTVDCEVLAVEPLERLELSWREQRGRRHEPAPFTTVSFVLARAAQGTLLRVTHRGNAPALERRLTTSLHALACASRACFFALAA